MSPLLFSFAGYGGAGLVLAAYGAVSYRHTVSRTIGFQLCNLAGAGLLIVYLWHLHAMPNVILNIVWFLVAAAALWRMRVKR